VKRNSSPTVSQARFRSLEIMPASLWRTPPAQGERCLS
jgi:hypothetical protein